MMYDVWIVDNLGWRWRLNHRHHLPLLHLRWEGGRSKGRQVEKVNTHTHTCTYIHTYMRTYIRIHLCINAFVYTHTTVYILWNYILTHVLTCVYTSFIIITYEHVTFHFHHNLLHLFYLYPCFKILVYRYTFKMSGITDRVRVREGQAQVRVRR